MGTEQYSLSTFVAIAILSDHLNPGVNSLQFFHGQCQIRLERTFFIANEEMHVLRWDADGRQMQCFGKCRFCELFPLFVCDRCVRENCMEACVEIRVGIAVYWTVGDAILVTL